MAKYRGFKAKCQGFSHKASDTPTPCQDAVAYKCGEGFAICAAADGHGSEKYFRSGNGAEIAVKIAVEAVKTFLNSRMVLSEENFNKLLKDLAAYIVSKWIDETRKHWDTTPCNDDEKTVFAKHYPNQNPLDKTLNVPRIYGTTLIVGAITEDFAFIIQCGDGAACIIPQDGNPNIPPVTIDENQIGGLANSISSLNCLTLFRYYYTDEIPISMLLVSDGVWTSYGGNNGDDFYDSAKKCLSSIPGIMIRRKVFWKTGCLSYPKEAARMICQLQGCSCCLKQIPM